MTVLDVPGPPNFAGTLVRSIPTQINPLWDISGTLKKIVHFRSFRSFWESGASFRSTKRQVLFTLYLPTIVNQQKSPEHILRAPNHRPNFGSKIQDTLEPSWDENGAKPL